MQKSTKNLPVGETYEIAKKVIDSKDIKFFMRTKDQEEYSPEKITFTAEKYRIPYVLRDMAALCTSLELSHFIADISRRMTHNLNEDNTYPITPEEMSYVIKFIEYGIEEYRKAKYVDLSNLIQ